MKVIEIVGFVVMLLCVAITFAGIWGFLSERLMDSLGFIGGTMFLAYLAGLGSGIFNKEEVKE